MADRFVFTNFAVAALQDAIDPYVDELEIHPNDVDKFPIPTQGVKFPLILSDTLGNVEICWATNISVDGVVTVERGRENTTPKSWLAGTEIIHAFTAETVMAQAKLTPKGTWNSATEYYAGDAVVYAGVSYIAVQMSTNQVPSIGSAYWQVLYQPPGAASSAMSNRGAWSNSTTYAIGEVVQFEGRNWVAKAASTNVVPSSITGADYWDKFSPDSTAFPTFPALNTTAAADNYVINSTSAPGVAFPTSLYDGMTVTFIPQASNTVDTPTLQLGGLAPKPLRKRKGIGVTPGSLVANSIYTAKYLAATEEFVVQTAMVSAAEVLTDNSGYFGAAGTRQALQTIINTIATNGVFKNVANTFTGSITFQSAVAVSSTGPTINMVDTDNGITRHLHHQNGLMGFLNSGSGWAFYTDNGGNLWTAGNVTAYSDRKLKKGLKRVRGAIAKLKEIEAYTYEMIETGEQKLGLIAQDAEAAHPLAVSRDANGTLGVNILGLLALTIEAVNELSEELGK